jgi:hypothetical protein
VNGAIIVMSKLVNTSQVKSAAAVLVSLSASLGGTTLSKPVCTRSLKICPPSNGTAGRQLKRPA